MTSPFYDPAPVFVDNLGKPVAGGFLYFYEVGTSTPKLTWSDQAKTTPNTNPVPLDAAGRANVNIWIEGDYTVWLKDSLGAMVWNRNINSGESAGTTIPALLTGQYLTNDGSNLLWSSIREVPDPTGSTGKILSTDGFAPIWIAQQTIPASPITLSASSIKYTGNSFVQLDQWGVQTMPANNLQSASMSFNFPTAFIEVPVVHVTILKDHAVVAEGFPGILTAVPTATGVNVFWTMEIDDSRPGLRLVNPFQFNWRAIGRVAS